MDTRTRRVALRGGPLNAISADDFAVYNRGTRTTFARLARMVSAPPLVKMGAYDFMAELRAARDAKCSY